MPGSRYKWFNVSVTISLPKRTVGDNEMFVCYRKFVSDSMFVCSLVGPQIL